MFKHESAFPHQEMNSERATEQVSRGLTKRELFAALALNGILSNSSLEYDPLEQGPSMAVQAADALLAELAKNMGLQDKLAASEAERDAYKRAKAENDERFMLERDEARQRVRELEAKIEHLTNSRLREWIEEEE